MNIVVFGASGRTGVPLVKQALAQGYRVTAVVRNPSAFSIEHENLTVRQGDILKAEDVEHAIAGQDAVISVIGQNKQSPKDLLTRGIRHIITAMEKHDVKRLISLTGAAVKVPKDVPQKWFGRLIEGIMGIVAKDVLHDGKEHARIIAESNRVWTIVRGPRLTEGPKTEKYRKGYFRLENPMISREDVAHFILRELIEEKYVGEYPLIGN